MLEKILILFVVLTMAAAPDAAAQLFDRPNRINVHLTGGKSITTWHGQADYQALNVETSRAISNRTELGIVVSPMQFWRPRSWFGDQYGDGNEKVYGIAGSLLGRYHFGSDSSAIRPYVELAGGPMWTTKQVPAATSQLNFITQPGFGVTLFPRERYALVVGYRFAHISNSGLASRNPGLNVHSFLIGTQLRPMPGRR
ncbi:MAG TPA: acyloxyacyl hydrolase [Thermoanaerobaculia bacterium]